LNLSQAISLSVFLPFDKLRVTKTLSFLTMTMILISCAQIKPLTGGEKDVAAPKEIESSPLNGSVAFNDEAIIIEFDEYIRLTNVSSQLIVSPLMETPPEISIKGKKLVIKLKSELAPNTTHSLNFGNAISDITENNVFPNYKYVFSTGGYIDSLSYSGTVINAFNQSAKENIYVLLYDQFEDSIPYKELPRYVALTDKSGKFSITNIANGNYKFFAINDINSNYLFDLPNEEIGFLNDKIQLDSSSSNNSIYLFEEESDLQYVVKSEHKTYSKIDIILNKSSEEITITPLNISINDEVENWSLLEHNTTNDSLIIWLTPNMETEALSLEIKDGTEIIDTIDFELIPKSEFKDTSLQITTNITSSFDLNKSIIITAKRPITKELIERIQLFEDSTLIQKGLEYPQFINSMQKISIDYPFKENTNYQLFIPPNTFEGIHGLKNDTVKIDFKTKKESNYGIINLTINPYFPEKYILQLSKNKKLVTEHYFSGDQTQQYKYLAPGIYTLKLIIDNNADGNWTTGNYLEDIQPEKVIFYEKEIKIRANWDNDIIWTVKE